MKRVPDRKGPTRSRLVPFVSFCQPPAVFRFNLKPGIHNPEPTSPAIYTFVDTAPARDLPAFPSMCGTFTMVTDAGERISAGNTLVSSLDAAARKTESAVIYTGAAASPADAPASAVEPSASPIAAAASVFRASVSAIQPPASAIAAPVSTAETPASFTQTAALIITTH